MTYSPRDASGGRRPAPPRQSRPTYSQRTRPAARTHAPRPARSRPDLPPSRRFGGKVALGVVSLLVLGLTGYAWGQMRGLIGGLTTADVIDSNRPADGATDILLVGMDSRTDAQGNALPKQLLNELNAGSSDGEENTDTLIMVHVPNNGGKAVAVSLPRDSYVRIPGFGQHKINSAYPRGKAGARTRLQESGDTDPRDVEVNSSQEGAKTLIAAVEQLTGSTIDNYASVNLLGFSDITQAVGGVDVCLRDDVNDPYSGAKFTKGRHTLSGPDALKFVRQRHGLPRGDLDRVVRQQAFMAGMANKVLSAGTLTDPGKLSALINAVRKSVVLNQGWDIFGFARQLNGLTGGKLEFRTIPVVNMDYNTPDDGKAIQIDPTQVRAFVRGTTGTPVAPAPNKPPATTNPNAATTVDVRNGTATEGLASTVSQALSKNGFTAGETGNASTRTRTTAVRYPAGAGDAARSVADVLGANAALTPDSSVPSGHVLVVVGSDYAGPDQSTGHAMAAPPPAPTPDAEAPITADGVTCVN